MRPINFLQQMGFELIFIFVMLAYLIAVFFN
jgi:hypothetical protein